MRIFSSVAMLGSLFVLAIGAGIAPSQETPDDADQEAVMQKWIEFMTPGAEHELLKNRVGKWSVKMEMWVSPDAPVSLSEGTSEMKLVMEGRYLLDSTKSTFQGRPFEGAGITGYDKLKKKFVSVWIDNFGTGFTISTGIYNEATKTYNFTTTSPDVALGEYKRTRTIERIVSDDEWVTEMYDTTPDGKEFLMMKGTYKRAR